VTKKAQGQTVQKPADNANHSRLLPEKKIVQAILRMLNLVSAQPGAEAQRLAVIPCYKTGGLTGWQKKIFCNFETRKY